MKPISWAEMRYHKIAKATFVTAEIKCHRGVTSTARRPQTKLYVLGD